MKRIIAQIVMLCLSSLLLMAQDSQCIFHGTVEIPSSPANVRAGAEVTGVWLLRSDLSEVRKADFNSSTMVYGVNGLSSDGFVDGDTVAFKILFTNDTVIARTSGDAAEFYGTALPSPPVGQSLRTINLFANHTPVISSSPVDSAREDFLYEYFIQANDADNDELLYSLISSPSWLTIDSTGRLYGTPSAADVGDFSVSIKADDGYFRGTDEQVFTLHVHHTNHAPERFHLQTPVNQDTVNLFNLKSPVQFVWNRSLDADTGDSINYGIIIIGTSPDTITRFTSDTSVSVMPSSLIPHSFYRWTVFSTDSVTFAASLDTFMFYTDVIDGITKNEGIPSAFFVKQNYPNPFNPTTDIEFHLPQSGIVSLRVYDAFGRDVATLVNEFLQPGIYDATWDAGKYASGVYYYRLVTNSFVDIKRMLLIR